MIPFGINLETAFIAATLKNQSLRKKKLNLFCCIALAVAGSVCMGVGSYMVGEVWDSGGTYPGQAVEGALTLLKPASILMLVLGLSGFISGMFGCFALYQGKMYQYKIFMTGLWEVTVMAFLCFILSFLFYYNVRGKIKEKALTSFLHDFSTGDEERLQKVWHPLQRLMRCCGVENVEDYQRTVPRSTEDVGVVDVKIPKSCCVQERTRYEPLNYDLCKLKRQRFYFTSPCGPLIEKQLTENSGLLLITSLFMMFIQIPAGLVFRKYHVRAKLAAELEAKKTPGDLPQEEAQDGDSQVLPAKDADEVAAGKGEGVKDEKPVLVVEEAAPQNKLVPGEAGGERGTKEISRVSEFTKVSEVKEGGKVKKITEVTTVTETKKRTGDAEALKDMRWSDDSGTPGPEGTA